MGNIEAIEGLEVEVSASDLYGGAKLSGFLVPPAEAGGSVRVSSEGMEMGLSDFALFALPLAYTPPLPVCET